MKKEKEFILKIANNAGKIMRKNFSLGMKKTWKIDQTPLTITDTAINNMVIEQVKKYFPEHGVVGEEVSYLTERSNVWVCDPVDGTVPFSHGYPTFVFSLALVVEGKSVLGVLYDVFMNRLLYGEIGNGTTLNNEPIHVSNTQHLSYKSIIGVDAHERYPLLRSDLVNKTHTLATVFYSASYQSMLVACGEFEAEIYEHSKPWDAAAVKIIVEEAGGKVTDFEGNDQRYDRPINGFIASNGFVHDEIIQIIKNQ